MFTSAARYYLKMLLEIHLIVRFLSMDADLVKSTDIFDL